MNQLNTKNLDELLTIGGLDLVIELIQLFTDDAAHIIQRLQTISIEDQQEAIGQIAHKLKSSAGSLGLNDLSDHCLKIDTKSRTGEFISIADVEQIVQKIQSGKELLQSYKNQKS